MAYPGFNSQPTVERTAFGLHCDYVELIDLRAQLLQEFDVSTDPEKILSPWTPTTDDVRVAMELAIHAYAKEHGNMNGSPGPGFELTTHYMVASDPVHAECALVTVNRIIRPANDADFDPAFGMLYDCPFCLPLSLCDICAKDPPPTPSCDSDETNNVVRLTGVNATMWLTAAELKLQQDQDDMTAMEHHLPQGVLEAINK